MKAKIAFTTILILMTSLSYAEELRQLSLDDLFSVSPRIQADGKVKVQGKSSLKITTHGRRPYVWLK